ncbi:DUF4102 domain-containing protein [Nostoc sp. 'Lobaria pulmonaria (5183) cyanobiont']|uniref:DUF4102 domain-containing protein n=1 Tax=Nostoc sp. 'Lobaria pulmonaria (5183) cyanobiont' TaxID=1618022 RepID=UPI000D0BF268|nr:DUF4102 domain-containing protein [Nostoc sp. 'Lobaria pulmonaria (5183) cyanobiont']AVH73827.1 hypothetical protein NLP_5529 [Nostoc sp. 'Lobaria pulmonaria (5183) cyanobiont']
MNQPTLFDLEAFTKSPLPTPVYDPAWDQLEKTAPQHLGPEIKWNPAHFGEVVRKVEDNGQISVFYDDSDEPPDPDDYLNLDDYEQAWREWELRVGAQVNFGTTGESRVGAQVSDVTQKVAPQHDTHWLEKYWVERSANKYWYYRYCWMVGRKKNRLYLGSVDSAIAKNKKADVEIAISDGQSPSEIEELIRSWRNQKQLHPGSALVHPSVG